MSKRKKNTLELLNNFLFTAVILTSIYVYFTTYNYEYTIETIVLGMIIMIFVIMSIKQYHNKKLLDSGINTVDKMSGKQFEEFLLAHFKNLGYKGHTTPITNDYGADLVVEKDKERIVIQAKRWQSKVKIEAIQQIAAAIQYYKANKGMVITNSFFTKNAVQLAESNNIELWDRNKLIKIMDKSNGKKMAEKIIVEDTIKSICGDYSIKANEQIKRICPICGNNLVLRNGKNGKFYGCSNYPKCKYTKNYKKVVM